MLEVANVMERITAYPFDEVTPELARRMTLSRAARQSLPDSELAVDVAESEPGPGRSAKRIAIRLRWRGRDGEWEAPVRLTSWIERHDGGIMRRPSATQALRSRAPRHHDHRGLDRRHRRSAMLHDRSARSRSSS